MAYRTGNPALRESTFQGYAAASGAERMTLQGVVNKSAFLLLLVLLAAFVPWRLYFQGQLALVAPLIWTGILGGLVIALVVVFKKGLAPWLAPVYALLEGLALGGISAFFESRFPGIVIQAVGLTFGVFLALLLAYSTGKIKPSENFKLGVMAATGGILVVYLVSMALGFFGIQVPLIHSSGPVGILFSLFVVVIAALNLVLDFDFIESGVERGAPRRLEWYAAFGLLVTLVWLYLEILRLLGKLRR